MQSSVTIEDVFARSSIVVATTGQVSKSVCTPMRMPFYSPCELRERIGTAEGRVSILFGRENWGLNNDEVKKSDMICTIPTADEYPIMNLSHAVGVVCYELANLPGKEYRLASPYEMGHLYRHIDRFLDSVHHPAFKRENTMIMIRRILGGPALRPGRRAPCMASCAGPSGMSIPMRSTVRKRHSGGIKTSILRMRPPLIGMPGRNRWRVFPCRYTHKAPGEIITDQRQPGYQ